MLRAEPVSIASGELDKLPEMQRTVVTLRDMLGFDSSELCTDVVSRPGTSRLPMGLGIGRTPPAQAYRAVFGVSRKRSIAAKDRALRSRWSER